MSKLSLDAVYIKHVRDVMRLVRAFGAPPADIEDLTHEVFLVVDRKLADFDGRNVTAWLYAISRNVVRQHRRKTAIQRWIPWSQQQLEELKSPSNPDSATEHEAAATFSWILSQMSPTLRPSFVLFEIEGYSGEEIAAMEQVPQKTVFTRLFHARKQFQKLVAKAYGLPEEEPTL